MKIILLLALGIMPLTIPAQTAKSDYNAESRPVDFRVNKVGYDTPYANVIKLLGKPKKEKNTKEYSTECLDKPTMFREMTYDGMEIGLMGDIRGRGMKVYSIVITSGKWDVSGIKIGATESQLTAKLGKPRLRSDLDYEIFIEYDTEPDYVGLSFHFKNKKLIKIVMEEAIC